VMSAVVEGDCDMMSGTEAVNLVLVGSVVTSFKFVDERSYDIILPQSLTDLL